MKMLEVGGSNSNQYNLKIIWDFLKPRKYSALMISSIAVSLLLYAKSLYISCSVEQKLRFGLDLG